MKAAHEQGIKVMLNGIGADEIFWGYQWIADAVNIAQERHAFAFYDLNADFQFAKHRLPKLYTTKFSQSVPYNNAMNVFTKEPVDTLLPSRMIAVLSRSWMFSDPVVLGDRLSMTHAIELRSPFLDYKLVELAVGLNKANTQIYQQPTKQLLKDAVADLLPDEVLHRPKQGFRPPVEKWMFGIIKRYGKLLFSGYLSRHHIIRPYTLLGLLAITSYRKAAQHVSFLYKLILLELWCRIYLEKADPKSFQ
jgi:asparagine synthase (glutamine-hydrolysing)